MMDGMSHEEFHQKYIKPLIQRFQDAEREMTDDKSVNRRFSAP
jgi:hypothetical protein